MSNKLVAVVTADIKQFNKKMDDVGKSAQSAARIAKMAFAGIATGIVAFGGAAIKTAADFDLLRTRMMALFGAARGAKIFDELAKKAKESSANTDDLAKAFITLSAGLGRAPDFELAEAVTFMAATAGKDVTDTARAVGKMVRELDNTGRVSQEVKDMLSDALGPNAKKLFEDLDAGIMDSTDALKQLIKIGKEQKNVYDSSLYGAIQKMKGIWQSFMSEAGEQSLEPIRNLIETFSKKLNQIQESGVIGKIAEGFAEIIENLDLDAIFVTFQAALGFLKAMMPIMKFLAKNWDTIVMLALAYEAAMITASAAQIAAVMAVNPALALAAIAAGEVAAIGLISLRNKMRRDRNEEQKKIQDVRVIKDGDPNNAFA